jgi:exonuclease III
MDLPKLEAEPSTKLRVVSWNLNHWQQPTRPVDKRAEAWEYLKSGIEADVALLQETVPLASLDRRSYVFHEIADYRPWGSAVVALDPKLRLEEIWSVQTPYSRRRFTIANTFPGSVAVGEVSIEGFAPITMVSVYGVTEVYAQTTILRVIADLIPLFDSAHGSRVILAGDLNIMMATKDERYPSRTEGILGALKSLGLVEVVDITENRPASNPECSCGNGGLCKHLPTWKGAELDHIYVTPSLANQVRSLRLGSDVVERGLSDHMPLILDLELDRRPVAHAWDQATFAAEVGRRHGAAAQHVIEELVAWAEVKERALVAAGIRGVELTRMPCSVAVDPEMWLQIDRGSVKGWMYTVSVLARGDVAVQFQYMRQPPFNTEPGREALRQRLNAIQGVRIEPGRLSGRPTFPLAVLEQPEALERLIGVLDQIVDESLSSPGPVTGAETLSPALDNAGASGEATDEPMPPVEPTTEAEIRSTPQGER